MRWIGTAVAALWASLVFAPVGAAQAQGAKPGQIARWVVETADHQGRPFAIVDKKRAQIHVFDGAGRLKGVSAALLGQAIGDHTAPGVSEKAQAGRVPRHERTTPAGRFASEPGRNLRGEHIVWVDYDSAFAIHRLRPGASRRQREARLASATPRDNRASLGCVVVPVKFYDRVVLRLLGRGPAVVYVLPESGATRGLLSSH